MDYKTKRLSTTEARGIANILLKAFGILYNAVPMKLTTSVIGGRQVITRVIYDLDKSLEPKIAEGFVDFSNSDEFHMNNVYELYWKSKKFVATIYESPEDCGYYSILPDDERNHYVFCIIQEKERFNAIKHEMCFGFDSKKRIFLELFDIDYHERGTIYSAEDSIESELRGRFVF